MVTKELFGTLPSGEAIYAYTIKSGEMTVKIGTLGATLLSLTVPDKNGNRQEVLLGYDTLDGYINGTEYLCATIGRFANRIKNGRFELLGKKYRLVCNDGANSLHGGEGFHKKIFSASAGENWVEMKTESPDGESGYPGKLVVSVRFCVENCALCIEYEAHTDAPTICNLTNHAYFNFSGGRENMLAHELCISAETYTATDETRIPTGDQKVENTPFDFRKPKKIGEPIFDHSFNFDSKNGAKATLFEQKSGIFMEVFTDRPAVQLYTSTMLEEQTGRYGYHYGKGHGVCLETQLPPDMPNRNLGESYIITPEKPFVSRTEYRFSVK